MNTSRKITVELQEINLSEAHEEAFYIREPPIETIARRLEELSLTPAMVSEVLDEPLETITDSLEQLISCPSDLLNKLLYLVGLELVAIQDKIDWRAQDGHWYYRERCVYCNVNMYDAGLYTPVECSVAKGV